MKSEARTKENEKKDSKKDEKSEDKKDEKKDSKSVKKEESAKKAVVKKEEKKTDKKVESKDEKKPEADEKKGSADAKKSGADAKKKETGKSLWVSNLSSMTRAADLKTRFTQYGKVQYSESLAICFNDFIAKKKALKCVLRPSFWRRQVKFVMFL